MKIIGITGTIGAGKGTVVDYLVKEKDFKHFSVRGFLLEILASHGNETPDRDDMLALANELRKEHGGAYIVERLYEQAEASGNNCVIESIRTIDEISLLKRLGKKWFSVDADPKLRYERAVVRGSETDNVTFEKFTLQEKTESEGADGSKPNLVMCRQLTEECFRLTNNGTFEELHIQIDEALKLVN